MLAFFFIGGTAFLFDGLQVAHVRVVAPTDSLSTSQLPVQLELVGFDVLTTLGVVAVEPNVDHFARVVHVLNKFDLTLGL